MRAMHRGLGDFALTVGSGSAGGAAFAASFEAGFGAMATQVLSACTQCPCRPVKIIMLDEPNEDRKVVDKEP